MPSQAIRIYIMTSASYVNLSPVAALLPTFPVLTTNVP